MPIAAALFLLLLVSLTSAPTPRPKLPANIIDLATERARRRGT